MCSLDLPLIEAIRNFIGERCERKIQDLEKRKAKMEESAFVDSLAQIHEQHRIDTWIDSASRRAKYISLVTHTAKYSHASTGSSGICLTTRPQQVRRQSPVDSRSLPLLDPDVTGSAAHFDVAAFLLLEAEGKKLLEEIEAGDSPSLRELATNDQYGEWMEGFSHVFEAKEGIRSGQLAKQVYFPVDGGYHLVSPLYASSLGLYIFQSVISVMSYEARKARREESNGPRAFRDFPELAVHQFGGSNKQNISLFNSKPRNGIGYLFSCRPPEWEILSKVVDLEILWYPMKAINFCFKQLLSQPPLHP